MIKFNERNISSSILTSTIKTKCKINSYYYFIQIFIDSIAGSEKITFLIKKKALRLYLIEIFFRRCFSYFHHRCKFVFNKTVCEVDCFTEIVKNEMGYLGVILNDFVHCFDFLSFFLT